MHPKKLNSARIYQEINTFAHFYLLLLEEAKYCIKKILTLEFKSKGFLIIYGCFNSALSSTSDCRSRGRQVEPPRKQSLFPIEKCFFFAVFREKVIRGSIPRLGTQIPPTFPHRLL